MMLIRAVLLLALAVSSGEASAAEPTLCEVLADDIESGAFTMRMYKGVVERGRADVAAALKDEAAHFAASEEAERRAKIYDDLADFLATRLVIRRELGCPKGGA